MWVGKMPRHGAGFRAPVRTRRNRFNMRGGRLSNLSVWRLRRGIHLERITPGHPEAHGGHERMHRTHKTAATKPAAANVLQQHARFGTLCVATTASVRTRPRHAHALESEPAELTVSQVFAAQKWGANRWTVRKCYL
jgi:hypothetical protein